MNRTSSQSDTSAAPLPATPPMQIIAHRGASHFAPENTLAAYAMAWEMGADAAETDIHLTSDNQIVCIHDDNAKRTTGVDIEIKSARYDQLRELDAGAWKDPKFAGERIPLLSEVLATLPPGKQFYVEVKCGPEVLPFLKAELETSGKAPHIFIIGFDIQTMAQAKKLMPEQAVFWLRGTRQDKDTNTWLSHDLGWIDLAKAYHFDGLDVNYGGVTQHFAQAVLQSGLKLVVWTVNEIPDATRMHQMGVEGLTTDRIDRMKPLP